MAVWRARDVEVLITTSTTATSSSDFSSATDYAGLFTSIEFTEPERSIEEVKFLGATGGVVNQEIYQQDPSMATLSGDLVLNPKSGESTDLSTVFYTKTGNDDFNYGSDPAGASMMIRFGGSTNYIGFVLTNVKLNTLGSLSLSADGMAEQQGFSVSSSADDTRKVYGGTYA